MIFFSETHTNALTSLLYLLGVKYTSQHAVRYFNEHPHKYNLFGLSRMLTYYGIPNKGIRVENKEDIYSLDPPFVAHVGNDFVAVDNVSRKDISYYWHQKRLVIPTDEFFNLWSGVVLVAEADETSIEPEYKQHKKEELMFEKGKYDRESFFKKYAFIPDGSVSEEFHKHLEWKEKARLQATPTILFDGFELPEIFFQQIDRLVFLQI